MNRAVFIARLMDGGAIDHADVDGGRWVIYDSEERSAIALTAKNLVRCGGSQNEKVHVHTLRKIVATEEVPW